jgi:hypothetical protein
MGHVYTIGEDGSTKPMDRIRCKNEDRELQLLLEKNPDLLPGDQINPEEPRRWLLVKREMPVPDPSSGVDRWSIDFFFVDQDATPTFVECKRFNDTRARREVVGQMFEYAANGHYYWTEDQLRGYAEEAAKGRGLSLEDAVGSIAPEDPSVDAFFERVEDNLREGQIRIVFFLEEAPMELRSVVDFLNKQMERSEVLLVEARQFSHGGVKVVVPTLFGYTEQARAVKRKVSVTTSGVRKRWDEQLFFEDAEECLEGKYVAALRKLYTFGQSGGTKIAWGTGKVHGSFSPRWAELDGGSVFTVTSEGILWINFGIANYPLFRKALKHALDSIPGFDLADDYEDTWPNVAKEQWVPSVDMLIQTLQSLLEKQGRNGVE